MFIFNNFSTCFGHHYAHLQENKTYVTAYVVLRCFCWMWSVAVVGRCLVGCEHSEGYCSTSDGFFFTFCLRYSAENYCTVAQATDDNMADAHCRLDT